MIVLCDVLHHLRGRTVPDRFAFQVGIETEGAVIGTAALALHADAVMGIGGIFGENGRDVRQVHGQVGKIRIALSESFDRPFALADDESLAVERLPLDDFQDGFFALPQDPDGLLRQLFDQLLGESPESPAADHNLRVRAGFADQPGVRKVGSDTTVVQIERLEAGK